MPELPEVETVVRTLRPHIIGRTITRAEFHSRFVTPGDRDALAVNVANRRIDAIERRGKFIWLQLDEGHLAIHLGMTGKLLFDGLANFNSSYPLHTYGIFELDADARLFYHDPRQFGRIEFSQKTPPRIAALGPEPLTIPQSDFLTNLKRRPTKIKPLLLNQAFLAGLGNIYVDEALFRAAIHPNTPAAKISRPKATALHQAIIDILRTAIEHRGSSISDYVDADGARGNFQSLHQVYGRDGQPCTDCGATIKRILVAQRGTHFCPKCQRR